MSFTAEQIEALKAKLDAKHVKKPPQGKYGDYVPAWHVIAEANRIFGFDGWAYSLTKLDQTNAGWRELTDRDGKKYDRFDCGYLAVVKVTILDENGVLNIDRQDVGHGQGYSKTNEGDAHDSAIKEAVTDALKRCLRTFGNPFGLALYDKSQENVERGNGRNGSTRPPPSNPVSPPTGADAEARLIRGINDRSTIVALNKFTGQSTFMEAFNSLDEGGRDKVQDAINARTSQLNNPLGGG